MNRVLILTILLVGTTVDAQPRAVKWTGWFSDRQCARITPGARAVFISEQAKAINEVRSVSSVKGDVGYYLEIIGEVDEKAKTISVKSVKRLSEVTASCLIPRRTH